MKARVPNMMEFQGVHLKDDYVTNGIIELTKRRSESELAPVSHIRVEEEGDFLQRKGSHQKLNPNPQLLHCAYSSCVLLC